MLNASMKAAMPAVFLRFGNHVQRHRRLARALGAVLDVRPRGAADAKRATSGGGISTSVSFPRSYSPTPRRGCDGALAKFFLYMLEHFQSFFSIHKSMFSSFD